MIFDLLSMAELTASAAAVTVGFAFLFGRGSAERIWLIVLMTLWFGLVLWEGATLALYYDGGLGVQGLGAAVLIPILGLAWAGLGTARGRAAILAAPLSGLIAIQAVRILGISFVLLYAAHRLPAPFAPVAGWGDIAIGATALPVAWLATRKPNIGLLHLWNGLGLLDLVAAVGLGALSSPGPIHLLVDPPGSAIMTTLPWIVIPCFLVPALSFVHLATWWRLTQLRKTAARAA